MTPWSEGWGVPSASRVSRGQSFAHSDSFFCSIWKVNEQALAQETKERESSFPAVPRRPLTKAQFMYPVLIKAKLVQA